MVRVGKHFEVSGFFPRQIYLPHPNHREAHLLLSFSKSENFL